MVRQNRISIAIVVTSILLFVGCAPAQYMPQFDDTTLRTKQLEISNQTERVPHEISEDPNAVLSRIYNRLEPRAKEACIANGEKWLDSSCSNWRVQVLDDENFNAYATPNHEIVFTTEVFRYTKSDDELAFILAHEMGHHILNHAMEDAVNAEIMGATTGLLSGILMGAIASGLGASESTVNDVIEDAIEDGYESGRESGRLTYSIDQESEADKLALQLIELADYSQAEARDIMLFIGADSNDLRSKHNASHPSGAERLAAFDLYARSSHRDSYVNNASSNKALSNTDSTMVLTDQADANAQFNLGSNYWNGLGVRRNHAEAFKWYRKAAAQGHGEAQYFVGYIYAVGRGAPKNHIKSYVWWSMAKIQGHTKASPDMFIKGMSQRKIVQAQALATKCYASEYKDCD